MRLEGGPVAGRDKLGPWSRSPHSDARATWACGLAEDLAADPDTHISCFLCPEHPLSLASQLNPHLVQPGKRRLRGTEPMAWEHLAGTWRRGLRGIGLSRVRSPGYKAVVRDLNSRPIFIYLFNFLESRNWVLAAVYGLCLRSLLSPVVSEAPCAPD